MLKFYSLWIVVICGLMGCGKSSDPNQNKKNTTEDRVESERIQTLKTTTVGSKNSPKNLITSYEINDSNRRYFFTYKATRNLNLHMTDETLLSTDCPTQPSAQFMLVPVASSTNSAYSLPSTQIGRVKAGVAYELQVDLKDIKGCSAVYVSFAIEEEEPLEAVDPDSNLLGRWESDYIGDWKMRIDFFNGNNNNFRVSMSEVSRSSYGCSRNPTAFNIGSQRIKFVAFGDATTAGLICNYSIQWSGRSITGFTLSNCKLDPGATDSFCPMLTNNASIYLKTSP